MSEAERKNHWEQVHRDKQPEERSWFQPQPRLSLALIEAAQLPHGARIIDVGGGTSRVVDSLVARGYEVTLLDISAEALKEARERLGGRAKDVTFVEADITRAALPYDYDLWHDRAVFHFLIDAADREAYRERLHARLRQGGVAIVATFALDGPERCSGLPVRRYDPEALADELRMQLVDTRTESHLTPTGKEQRFVYALLRK